MKKTQRKDAIRNIVKRLVSYLSVVLVVTLGLGGLFTTRYMGAGIQKQATDYYDSHSFKNYEFVSSYGISDANLEKIKSNDQVTDAEGVIQADGAVSFGGQKRNATIISLTEKVSVPDVTEGRLPEGKDECLIGEDFAEIEGLKVGDKVRISVTGLAAFKDQIAGDMNMDISTDEDGDSAADEDSKDENTDESPLYSKEFTITGLMHHPDYLRRKATNTVSLPLSAFNTEVTEGLYTRAFVRIEQPEKVNMFDDKYFDETEDTTADLEALAEELAADRTNEVKDEAYRMIDERWAEAEAQLAAAQGKIDAGEDELNSKLSSGRAKLNAAQKKLDKAVAKAEKKIADGEKKIADGEKDIAEAEKKIKEGEEELAKYKKLYALLDQNYAAIEQYLNQLKAIYGSDLDEARAMLNTIQSLLDKLDKIVDRSSPEYKAVIEELANIIVQNKALIIRLHEFFNKPEVMQIAVDVKDLSGGEIDLTGNVARLRDFQVDAMIAAADEIVKGGGDVDVFLNYVRAYIKELQDFLDAIAQAEKYLAWYKDGTLKKMLDDKEAELNAGTAALADAKKKLEDGKKKLADSKKKLASEKKKNQKKIDEGWAKYYAEKAKYEKKLDEAIALLATNREKAEEKLAEAKAEVNNIDPCNYVVLDRKSNSGYVDMKSNIDAIASMGVVFGVLFTIITAIVCLSTLVIIIDEQKTLVGTSKAFGFFRREVLAKYLVFGVSAAVVGALLAVLGAYLLSGVLQTSFASSGMYPIGVAKSIVTIAPTLIFSLIIIAVTVAATVIACGGILKSPASMLMKGAVLKKEKKGKKEKTKASGKGGSLYSRLIIRNIVDDKARVIVTISIIAFSCMLIGMGISMKLAYDGMMDRQSGDVNRYDIRMDMNTDVTDEDEAALVKVLEENNTEYMPVTFKSTLYRWNNRLDGVTLICANPERISEFYGITDENGQDITLPDDGILIQKRMHESYGIDPGEMLPVLDSTLEAHDAEVKGTFVNYVGRTIVMSPAAYKKVFGEVNQANSYFIRLNGADSKKLTEELLAASDNVSFSYNGDFKTKFQSVTKLYNLLVLIVTGIAILISFMILTNLANIYLTRKKTELTVMRVNGFTIKETKGYLSKESILTTGAGLLLGVLVGAILTPLIIKAVQQPDLEFVKSFQVIAWAVAVALEGVFAAVINSFVYRKVKDLNLRDIA